MEWPERWYAWRAGEGCPSCTEGRPDELPMGVRYFEAAAYGREVLAVGRTLETTFSAVKMNYNVLGNWVPHLHTHVVPRYPDDPRPGWPFPFPEPDPGPMPEERLSRDVALLRAVLAQ